MEQEHRLSEEEQQDHFKKVDQERQEKVDNLHTHLEGARQEVKRVMAMEETERIRTVGEYARYLQGTGKNTDGWTDDRIVRVAYLSTHH